MQQLLFHAHIDELGQKGYNILINMTFRRHHGTQTIYRYPLLQ